MSTCRPKRGKVAAPAGAKFTAARRPGGPQSSRPSPRTNANKKSRAPRGGNEKGRSQDPKDEDAKQTNRHVSMRDFERMLRLGKGGFGEVLLCRHKKTNSLYAMKTMEKTHIVTNSNIERAVEERSILQSMDHPFCVRLVFAFQDDKSLYLVMNYVSGGNLYNRLKTLKKFPEEQIQFYAAEIAAALEYLHQAMILYRDLKLENVMIGMDGHVQLTDFGLAKLFGLPAALKKLETASVLQGADERRNLNDKNCRTQTICGTAEYFAPEMVNQTEYGVAVDWWTYGILVFEMLNGKTPFSASTEKQNFENILKQKIAFASDSSIMFRSLVTMLLERNPTKRLGSDMDSKAIKSHMFFTGLD